MASSLWLMWQTAPLLKDKWQIFPGYILGYKRYEAAWPVPTYIHILNVLSAFTQSTYLFLKMEILLQYRHCLLSVIYYWILIISKLLPGSPIFRQYL